MRVVGTTKSQVVIRRPTHAKPHPRTRVVEEEDRNPSASSSSSIIPPISEQDTGLPTDELTRIRVLLRPPPIPGGDDWGIPHEPTGPCDPDIEVSRTPFQSAQERLNSAAGEAGTVPCPEARLAESQALQRLTHVQSVIPQSASLHEARRVCRRRRTNDEFPKGALGPARREGRVVCGSNRCVAHGIILVPQFLMSTRPTVVTLEYPTMCQPASCSRVPEASL